MNTAPTSLSPDHEQRLAAGQACLEAALHVYLPQGFSVTCCCDPDHVGVSTKHGKACQHPGKAPMHTWKERQGHLPTAPQVAAHWRTYPIGNVGCVLGQVSGLVRVDVDGAPGEAALTDWSQGDLPPTWEFCSSAAGRGLLYRWPHAQPCHTVVKDSPDGQHTELRLMGNGSQTVLPPSRHVSGSIYTWVPGHSPDALPLAPAPAWLVARMTVEPRPEQPSQAPPEAPTEAYAAELLRYIPNPGADRETWLAMGMALHSTGTDWAFALWDTWSQQYPEKYDAGDQAKTWQSFTVEGPAGKDPITFGTLVHLARGNGYQRPRPTRRRGRRQESAAGPQPSAAPGEGAFTPDFNLTKDSRPRPILFNLIEAIEKDPAWQGVLRYNAFSGQVELHAPPPPLALAQPWKVCPLEEWHASEIARWLQEVYDLCTTTALVEEALVMLAHRDSYNPVCDYLMSLKWDDTPRLDTWLHTYCHVEDTPFSRAVAAKTLIAGVARILQPGCKADTLTILIGPQGYLKSWVWRALASESWFTDHLSDLHSKDAAMDLRSKWIVEFADLDNFGRSELETIKRFLSATQDHYRPPYGRHASTVLRSVIFAGTTNKDTFLKDETGNRRFWPVQVRGRCDVMGLLAERDQLWAEAVSRFQAGEAWHLTGEVLQAAEEEQRARVEVDPWTAPVLTYLHTAALKEARYRGQSVPFVTTNELLEYALGLDKLHWTTGNNRRVAAILRLHNWHHAKVENPTFDKTQAPDPVRNPRQRWGFIPRTDETDEIEDCGASVRAASPHKTSLRTDEIDEIDSLNIRKSREEEEGQSEVSIEFNREPSVSSVPSVRESTTPSLSKNCAETDAQTDVSVHLSETPPRICPTCKRPSTWRIRAEGYVCYKCEIVIPRSPQDPAPPERS